MALVLRSTFLKNGKTGEKGRQIHSGSGGNRNRSHCRGTPPLPDAAGEVSGQTGTHGNSRNFRTTQQREEGDVLLLHACPPFSLFVLAPQAQQTMALLDADFPTVLDSHSRTMSTLFRHQTEALVERTRIVRSLSPDLQAIRREIELAVENGRTEAEYPFSKWTTVLKDNREIGPRILAVRLRKRGYGVTVVRGENGRDCFSLVVSWKHT